MMKKYFTTPIYYVNDIPHIGHAYCTLATDTLVRYWRKKLGKENVFFLTGTDENSQKTVDAAKLAGKPIPEYLEGMAKIWRTTFEKIGIEFDDFIRTTEERHLKKVHELFTKIHEGGDIYKGKYTGKYCHGCETFLKESELDEEGNCPDHKKPPVDLEEENYFFRLSKYEKPLLELYEKNPSFLEPESRRNEILNFIKSGLEDISISRETSEFGISLPIDENHKVYVWFDALINYLSGLPDGEKSEFWGEAVHIIGKDITRFHCVIWPAMLLAAGIKPYKQVFAHGFFTIDGQKMSKSLGNVVSPVELAEKYGNDALRVGLIGSFEFGHDGDFSLSHFDGFYNSKLAGGVGNLFNRVVVLIHKFLDGKKPEEGEREEDVLTKFNQALEKQELQRAINIFFEYVGSANQLLNETEVWKLVKEDLEASKKVFATLLQKLEILAEMAEVILPETAPRMRKMLGNAEKVGEPEILFERK
ncbi:methionine--tRNA ligase [Candidatus Gracilibacteria bacterium]|nr:methionine--tRNA ligase [Candidatus Gracilibacteria bacterium]